MEVSSINYMKGGKTMIFLCLMSTNEYTTDTDYDILDKCIEKIADKDNEALAELYVKTSTSVYSFALSILKNTYDAEDVLHDCYLNVYSAAGGYCSTGKPLAWIITITRNLCLHKIRERKKTSDIPQECWEQYIEVNENMSSEDRIVLSECMNRLTDEERQIVVLHVVSGFKHREIAQILSLRLSTVLSKYNRALKKLKNHIMKGAQNL